MLTICVVTDNTVHADWQAISARLRGATIDESAKASRGDKLPEACHSVVFLGSQALEKMAIERALGAGKHVVLATEPCFSSEVLQVVSGVAQKNGVQFAVVNPDRYLPSRQLIKQQIDGKFGDVGLVRIHRWESVAAEATLPHLGLPAPLVRDIEQVLWLAGKPPTVVYAREHAAQESLSPRGRFLQIHLGFSGGMALIDYTAGLPAGAGYNSLSVIGSTGAAYGDDHQNMQLLYRGGAPQALRTGEGTRHLAAMLQEFVDAVATRQDLSATVTAWRRVLTVVDDARQSLVTHRAIHREAE